MEDYVYGQPALYLIVRGGFIILIFKKIKWCSKKFNY